MDVKQSVYRRDILKHLYFSGDLSCEDLSELTNKSFPLTSKILIDMVEKGAVIEKGYAASTGGRRPQMYTLRRDLMYVVSVAMDQMITRMAILDMQNKYVGEVKNLELTLTNNPNALNQLINHLEGFIHSSGIPKNKIAGIGIGMPGFVDVIKGINHSFMKTEKGQSISGAIESALGVPVLIDNDSSLIALAELKFGAARGKENVMVINAGWGVGLGMIMKGEMFRGNNGFAGEFSHIPLFSNNKMCSCGKMGCLETETSLVVMAEKAMKALQEGKLSILKGLSLEHIEEASKAIIEAAVKGDKFAIEILSEIGYKLGIGVAILIHLLNPELIVLSGRGSVAGKIWLAPLQQAINEHCIPKISENTEIEISELGYDAEIIGAAALVMENYEKVGVKQNLKLYTDQYAE